MSLLALAELRLADFRLVAPYAFAMAVVPTIACAAGAEHPPPWPIITLSHRALLRHFTHHAGTDRWWTLLTSALCHSNLQHLQGNLVALLTAGRRPSMTLGAEGFALLFFGGHIAASLNTAGSRKALENYLNASTGQLAPSLIPAAARVVSLATGPPQTLGASAGVFASLGFELSTIVEEVWHMLPLDPYRELPPPLLWLAISGFQIATTVLAERRAFNSGASLTTGHYAHLTGFCWGVGVYLARRFATSSWRRYHARRRFRGGGGRRLGGR